MGTLPSRISLGRVFGVGLVVFTANAALLVLQLVAGRLLSPYIGSSLETWTSVIGVFLAGIALGNGFGGRIADRYPTPRTLAVLLGLGSLTALWMVTFPMLLQATDAHTGVTLGVRIPLLAFLLCFPAGLTLSLLTPLAIKLGLPDVSKAGRVVGVVFALGTLGCLVGNYLTGFYLIPSYTLDTIVQGCAAVLGALAIGTFVLSHGAQRSVASPPALRSEDSTLRLNDAILPLRKAYLIVFLASFGGMTLELAGVRLLARELGVSLFTWTGIIGVMLAGTAVGNILGGQIADRFARKPGDEILRGLPLAITLLIAAGATSCIFVVHGLPVLRSPFEESGLPTRVIVATFLLFFPPMMVLGMISPQVIRLAIPDVGHAGTVAGRIYGWSTAGAIAGTFASGYVMLSGLGVNWTIVTIAFLFILVSVAVAPVWRSNAGLYLLSIAAGGVFGSLIHNLRQGPSADPTEPGAVLSVNDSNYYTILVVRDFDRPWHLKLNLDHLLHSVVDPQQPTYLYYEHEGIQMEMLRDARTRNTKPRMLVIGGGGFTFPRCAKTLLPEATVEVVEIDPAVTSAAVKHLGFDPKRLDIPVFHMDGRQFVAEKVQPSTYDLIVLDAVNDYSVPSHLTTREFNESVKKGLTRDGVYLLTVIDGVSDGKLWKAAYHTLKQSFAHVELVSSQAIDWEIPDQRHVFVLYASDRPLDAASIWNQAERRLTAAWQPIQLPLAAVAGNWTSESRARVFMVPMQGPLVKAALENEKEVILTDQFAPVDNLLADVFRKRDKGRKPVEE